MYTLILMSSRGNSVRQHAISHGRVLLLSLVVFIVFLAAISGIGYGLFQKRQSINAEEKLQTSLKEIEQLAQAKLQVESELAGINEEMKGIRDMTEKIQQALGILGQGGGDSGIPWASEGNEEQADTQQENTAATTDAKAHAHKMQRSLTTHILKQEILPFYDYVSDHQKQIDGHPSILPVKLEQENGEKYAFWYSSAFGWRTHPLTKKREFHHGLDIKTRAGIPVIAAADGTVVNIKKSGYLGKTIEITHESLQFKTLYAHLKGYADNLKTGQKVVRGEIIGYVGNTGRSTGAHLHYGVYDIETEKWVNPIKYILDQQPMFSP